MQSNNPETKVKECFSVFLFWCFGLVLNGSSKERGKKDEDEEPMSVQAKRKRGRKIKEWPYVRRGGEKD